MVTPEEARRIAELLDNAPYSSSCTNDAADALRDLASQVESLQAELAQEACQEQGDMTLEQAMNLGKLWAAGKLIGGDAYAAAAVLAGHMESLQADAERYRFLQNTDNFGACRWGMVRSYDGPLEEGWEILTDVEVDAAIDEARKQS